MKKFLSMVMVGMLTLFMVGCGSNTVENKDAKETSTVVDEKSDVKIIGGSMAVSEMLGKLDVNLIGRPTTQYGISDKLKPLPEIGLPMSPDLEKIRALNPDIYITSGTLREMLGNKLEENGINTVYLNLDSYDDVKKSIKEVGTKFNKEENAEKLINEIEAKEKKVLENVDKNKKVKVMILFGAPGHFMLASKNSFAGSLIEKLGAENIASKIDFKGQYVPFSLETALNENPDVILRMYHGYIDEAKKQADEEFATNPQWKNFKAVQENKVYDLDPEYFGVTGDIKIADSLEKMKDYLYK